jgi:hypothetical protein
MPIMGPEMNTCLLNFINLYFQQQCLTLYINPTKLAITNHQGRSMAQENPISRATKINLLSPAAVAVGFSFRFNLLNAPKEARNQ